MVKSTHVEKNRIDQQEKLSEKMMIKTFMNKHKLMVLAPKQALKEYLQNVCQEE